jgi:hypothetical protein
MLELAGVVLAGLVAGAQAAADLMMLILVTNHNSYDLILIHGATDQLLTRVTAGNQPLMAVISAAGKVYSTGTGTDTASRVNNAALLCSLLRAANQDTREVTIIDSVQDTTILYALQMNLFQPVEEHRGYTSMGVHRRAVAVLAPI